MKNNTQNLLKVTRKSIFSVVCTFGLLAASGTGIAYAAETSSDAVSDGSAASVIGSEAAQNFAFADAGVDPLSATAVFTEYDYENGQFVYEVEFTADGVEYEYQIQAYDGSVMKKSVEYTSLLASLYAAADSGTSLTLEEAKELAQNDAELLDAETENKTGGTEESTTEDASENSDSNTTEEVFTVTFTKEKLDDEDGLSVYDIEFYTVNAQYEYEISVASGDIISFSVEWKQNTAAAATADAAAGTTGTTGADNSVGTSDAAGSGSTSDGASGSGSSSSCISVDEAKAIALERAGVSASDVTFKKAKLDKEDGIMVYEVEFCQGQMEYECTINASTGTIIEFESEWDD